jgi:DNA helicase-2/ATP-dependent DNA helicase PcrA
MLKDIPTYDKMFKMIEKTRELYKKIAESEEIDNSDKVQLMTLHSAKGLEFKEVHIIDLYDGNIPHKKSRALAEIEEERRMLYVGITRSSDKLFMYVPMEFNESKVKPSRFIKDYFK